MITIWRYPKNYIQLLVSSSEIGWLITTPQSERYGFRQPRVLTDCNTSMPWRFSTRLTMSTTLWCATAGCRTTPPWWWEWWLPAPTATASRQPLSTSKSSTCPTSVAWSGSRRTRSKGNGCLLHKRYCKSRRYTRWKSPFFLRKWLIFTIFGVYLQSLRVRITRARA